MLQVGWFREGSTNYDAITVDRRGYCREELFSKWQYAKK